MDTFHSRKNSTKHQKSTKNKKESLFNGLDKESLLEERKGREVIDFSRIDTSIENYNKLKELVHNSNRVAIDGNKEEEKAYFEHIFRRGLGINLYKEENYGIEESHNYDDLISQLAAVNSELTQSALEEARLSYKINFNGSENLYEEK